MNNPADTLAALAPCPFCGGRPVLMANSVVECRNCPTGKYSGYVSADIAAWNRRTPQPDKAGVGGCIRCVDREMNGPVHVVCRCDQCKATPPPPGAGEDRLAKYDELMFAVCRKWPGESRHETALRYIRAAENQECGPAMTAALAPKENK